MPQSILQNKKDKKKRDVAQSVTWPHPNRAAFQIFKYKSEKKQVVAGVKYYSKNNFYTENFVLPSLASTLEPLKMGYYV